MGEPDAFMQTTESKPCKFRLHWFAFLCSIIFVVPRVVLAFRPGNSDSTSYQVGYAIGGILTALIFGWLAYRITGRSNLLGNAVFCVVLLTSYFGKPEDGQAEARKQREAVEELIDVNKEITGQALTQMQEDGYLRHDPSAPVRMTASLDNAAASLRGSDKAIAECSADMLRSWQPSMDESNAAMKKYVDMGGLSAQNITSPAQIAERLEALQDVEKKQLSARRLIQGAGDWYTDCLTKKGVSGSDLERAIRAFQDGSGIHEAIQLRDATLEAVAASKDHFTLLEKQWGRWTSGATADSMRFEDSASADSFKEITLRIRVAIEKETRLQRLIFENSQGRNHREQQTP